MVALDHVQAHGLAVLHHLVDERLELGELVDVVAVRLCHALHGRLAVLVGLEPHHLGLGAGPEVEAGLLLEGLVDALQVAAAVRREEGSAVNLFLTAPEESAEDAGGLGVPRELAEGLGLGDADQLTGLGSVADVFAVPVDEQVGRGPVDQLEALVGNGGEMLGRYAFAHDPPGDGNELAVEVLDSLDLDTPLDLGDLLGPPRCLDELLDIGHVLPLTPWGAFHLTIGSQ